MVRELAMCRGSLIAYLASWIDVTYPNQEEIHYSVVYLARLEHSLRPDGAPNDRGIVNNLGPIAGETLRIG